MFLTCLSLSKHSGLLTMSVFLGILTSYLISHYRFGEKYNPIAICGMILLVSGIIKATINKPK
jgi:multidrug transporter EmrE-like cation transporter